MSPPVTAWTPSSFHLLATTRAGCYLHFRCQKFLFILCYFPKYAPKSSQKFFTVSLSYTAHDVTPRDRLDAIFLPLARYHTSWLLFAFAARNSSLSSFSWHIQEYPYPLFKDVIVILHFECILYRSLLSGKEIFVFLFRYCSYHFRKSQSGKPALTGGLHPNAHFSFPGPLGQVRPEPPL